MGQIKNIKLHIVTDIKMSNNLYAYCEICRINHDRKRKHVYSKKHKEKVNTLLDKFAKRIKEIRLFLQNPVVEEGEPQSTKKTFWCQFCRSEYPKHVTDKTKTIMYGGVLEHLSCYAHSDALETFWFENGVKEKDKEVFRIPKANVELYKNKLMTVVDEHDKSVDKRTEQIASQIQAQEFSRKVLLNEEKKSAEIFYQTIRNKHGVLQNPSGCSDGIRVWKGGIVKYESGSGQVIESKYTKQSVVGVGSQIGPVYACTAQGKGLACVKVPSTGRGNINTGATPPWLLPEPSEEAKTAIGPSQADFDRYCEQKKKSKLNPNRVGANFNHTVVNGEDSSDWLPSFGAVWNEGARWKSRTQFKSR